MTHRSSPERYSLHARLQCPGKYERVLISQSLVLSPKTQTLTLWRQGPAVQEIVAGGGSRRQDSCGRDFMACRRHFYAPRPGQSPKSQHGCSLEPLHVLHTGANKMVRPLSRKRRQKGTCAHHEETYSLRSIVPEGTSMFSDVVEPIHRNPAV